MRTTIRPTLAAGALAAAGLLAMGSAVAATNASPADLPPEMAQGNVKYMSGGIGIDEAEAMRAEAARYPLTLEFAERASPKDVYLAAVDVHIVDQSGRTTLDAVSEGPLMLLRLPAGTYRVTAEHDGKSETRDVTVTPGKPGRLFFEWS